METMDDYGISAEAWKAKQRAKVREMMRKAKERAAAYRVALVVTDIRTEPRRIVFQTPHGPAYRKNGVTLPFVSVLGR